MGRHAVNRRHTVDARETIWRGHFAADRITVRHDTFAGGESAPLVLEVFDLGQAACVLPWEPASDSVLLVEQFRGAVAALADPPWLLETIAGDLGPGEAPEAVARREAMEEAALALDVLIPAGRILPCPGAVATCVHAFVAPCALGDAGGVFGLAEEGEDILVHVLPLDEALAMVDDGRIEAAHATIPLLWLARHRDRLRAGRA